MSLRGAPRVLGAQEYTSQLKNRVVARDVAPQPATRRYNYVPISAQANRANQVVKLISVPEKSCAGGWTDASDCCKCSDSVDIVVDPQGNPCECSQFEINQGCPGLPLLYPFNCPKRVVTVRFNPDSFAGTATSALVVSGQPYVDFTGTTATIDGAPASAGPVPWGGEGGIGGMVLTGEFTTSSVITFVFPQAIGGLGAFCVDFTDSPV